MEIRILVADDSASDRLIIKTMLKGYTVLTACDGVEAMRMLEKDDGICILILDLNMPNMTGFEVLEAIKNKERYRKLHTIILTNYDEIDNEIKGLRLGAVDYIRKPIHMDSLLARIEVHSALILAKEALEQLLDEQTVTFGMIFDRAPIGIAIAYSCDPNRDKEIAKINSVFEQITGRTKKELVDCGWAAITHPEDLDKAMEYYNKLKAGEISNYSLEQRFIKPDGSAVWVYMVVAVLSPNRECKINHMCLIQDISERKQMETERKYISEHDRLTGLYNRSYLYALLAADAVQKQFSKRALIGINLSTVHLLTANYGYMYTQGVIKKAAEALYQHSSGNRFLCHTHENRFVFYMTDYKDKRELVDFCEGIAETLESVFVTDRIGGGIGILEIAQGQRDETDTDLLLRRLLIASERSMSPFAKEFDFCFYDEELEALVNRETDIREALTAVATDAATNDTLYLQFQPIINLRTGSVCGFEALARLRTEKLGLVSPVEFIPIAEKTKLIIPIGEKVMEQALLFLNKLKASGYGAIEVSINVSAIQLLRPDFINRLFELICKMQVNPDNICIEITESIFSSDYEKINRIVEKLKAFGLHIAIDDFGTGYSSLAREKELNVDCLKIDKYFMDKLINADLDKAITSDIISMAHKLGHCAVAEGVEYEDQLRYLKKYGCDKIQGYFISRPLNEDVAFEFLTRFVGGALAGAV